MESRVESELDELTGWIPVFAKESDNVTAKFGAVAAHDRRTLYLPCPLSRIILDIENTYTANATANPTNHA